MKTTAALREALNEGMSSGNFVDTKIILYSRRDYSGRICKPKPLYASSHVLKTVPYFKDCEFITSFSGLEEFHPSGVLFGDSAESQSRGFEDPIDEQECAEDYGYSSDSDLEEEDGESSTSKHAGWLGVSSHACENHKEPVGNGKVVKISDIAFVTFQAFLMYLYTDSIVFAPFGSEENRRSRRAEMKDPSNSKIPCSSPKSIYRLADKYDIPPLKTHASNQIRSGLGKCDIVGQSFSKFASQYGDIKALYIQKLAFDWMNARTMRATRASFQTRISGFAEKNPAHTTEVLHTLLDMASQSRNTADPTKTSLAVTHTLGLTSVTTALIKSAREGTFFDRKYWARRFKTGDVLTPVYFSSLIMDDKAQQLNKVVNYLDAQNSLSGDLEGDVIFESDCEEASPTVERELSTTEEREGRTRAVLTHGSFLAWKSLFFYLYTDEISFAPLKSQGMDSRSNYVREKTVTGAPPPCSPKSIYVLADMLGIPQLRENAFSDIKSKVTLNNVVGEVFSWVTASQKEITRTQCDLLVPNLKKPGVVALVKKDIKDMADRSPSRCVGVLVTVLENVFESKKQRMKTVRLQCRSCSKIVPYASVRQRALPCRYGHDVNCAYCGCRVGSAEFCPQSCRNCGKRFK